MKQCSVCKNYKETSFFSKRAASKDGFQPLCKSCVKDYESLPHVKEKRKLQEQSLCLKEKRKAYKKTSKYRDYLAKKEVMEAHNSSVRKFNKLNPDKKNALTARRRAAKIKATPKWLTEEQLAEIREFYSLAKELQWLSDPQDPLEVDHIMPLLGENLCGLHVPWNLQILPRSLNKKKSNKILKRDDYGQAA